MIYLLQSYRSNFLPWIILIFVGISVLSNILKKLTQSGQKPPTGPPGAKPARKSFLDLIEDVRKMAEGEGEEGKPRTPGETGPTPSIFNRPRQDAQPRQPVRTPIVPKLKPVGQVIQPKTRETPRRLVFSEEEMRAKAAREEAEKRARDPRERARREKEQRRKQIKRAPVGEKKTEVIRGQLYKRYERPVMAESPSAVPGAVDYSRLLESRESVRNAIILREVLGLPRAMRRYSSRRR